MSIEAPDIESKADKISVKLAQKEEERDKRIVDRFKNGDESAFEEIFNLYWERIFSFILPLLRNRQDAEEVAQDTFIRTNRGLVNFRGDSSFSTWLHRIALNLARNKY